LLKTIRSTTPIWNGYPEKNLTMRQNALGKFGASDRVPRTEVTAKRSVFEKLPVKRLQDERNTRMAFGK
jgi:hypothetical protein